MSKCNCNDLRHRRWNPHTGICETCGKRFKEDPPAISPPSQMDRFISKPSDFVFDSDPEEPAGVKTVDGYRLDEAAKYISANLPPHWVWEFYLISSLPSFAIPGARVSVVIRDMSSNRPRTYSYAGYTAMDAAKKAVEEANR